MTRKRLKQIIKEILLHEAGGGEASGKLELVNISLDKARQYCESIGINLDKDLPNFDYNFKYAQQLAGTGRTKRKDMPVINDDDVKQFQQRLKDGYIDIYKPFAPTTNTKNPFPNGLSGFDADSFLSAGLKDGEKTDDVVKITIKQIPVGKLKPIQKQIYFDKSMEATAKFGIAGTTSFISSKTFFIASDDNFIIDGHHRFLSGVLINPKMKVNVLSIDLPIRELLPLSISYGDAIGNRRNA